MRVVRRAAWHQEAQGVRVTILKATTELVSVAPQRDQRFADVLASSSGSAAGFHANSEWLTCPENARLRALGIKFRGFESSRYENTELNALDFGTLMHALLAFRVWYGHDAAMQQLDFWRQEIGESYVKASLMLGTYEQTFPQAMESLTFLGVECEVITNIRMGDNDPRPCLRTVRYDAVVLVRAAEDGVPQLYSLERKTMARSGGTTAYSGQGMVQMMLWNNNAALVAKHGPMRGVIFEALVKTKNPSVDRIPAYFAPSQQDLAREYMRHSESGRVQFKALPDGTYPKMLHACWGRWRPCDYISGCHEQSWGDYVDEDGNTVGRQP